MANRWGNGIPLRNGNPLWLLKYTRPHSNEPGKIDLNPDAIDIISRLDEHVCVVSIVGSYRQGKSLIANVFHGRLDGFALGAEVYGKTRGIWMWDTPFIHDGKRVIVLDCEGIDDPDQDHEWATKLFILCLAISSTFIYNLRGAVGASDIGKLFLMENLKKYIEPPEGTKFMPHLVVLLRDFQHKPPDDFQEYFLKQLARANAEAAEGIKKSFREFSVFPITHPGVFGEQLHHLENEKPENLHVNFVKQATHAVTEAIRQLSPKYIGDLEMSGLAFTTFLKSCVDKMNDPENKIQLSIPSEYESVIQYVAQHAIDESVANYDTSMKDEMETLPILWDQFDQIHDEYFGKYLKSFFGKVIGSAKQIQVFEKKFTERIQQARSQYVQMNSVALREWNSGILAQLWEKHIEKGLTPDHLFDRESFDAAVSDFQKEYNETCIQSPEAGEELSSFMKIHHSAALTKLTQLGVLKEKYAEEMRARQEAENEYREALARAQQAQTDYENEKRDREKLEKEMESKLNEIQDNIEREKIRGAEEIEKLRVANEAMIQQQKDLYEQKLAATNEKLEKAMKEANRKKGLLERVAGWLGI